MTIACMNTVGAFMSGIASPLYLPYIVAATSFENPILVNLFTTINTSVASSIGDIAAPIVIGIAITRIRFNITLLSLLL